MTARRHVTGEDDTTNSIVSASSRDFTGHEFLEELRLVHMGGRIYDPVVARFLSPDPFVQDPFNLQNLNRYSYVLNNPLAYTDPDGFFFKSVFRAVFGGVYAFLPREVRQVVKPILVTFAFAINPQTGIFVATYIGAIDGALSGGLKGAIFGAVTSGASAVLAYGIGQLDLGILPPSIPGGPAATAWDMGADIVAKSALHGVAQGALATAQGGEFGPAFLAASFSHAVGGGMQATDVLNGEGFGLLAARTLSAAVAGGTAAVIGGGKFANGAMTAAFVHLFNAENFWTSAGRDAHAAFSLEAERLGLEANRRVFNGLRPDAILRQEGGGRFFELKPETPTGIYAGRRQIKAYSLMPGWRAGEDFPNLPVGHSGLLLTPRGRTLVMTNQGGGLITWRPSGQQRSLQQQLNDALRSASPTFMPSPRPRER